jgi:hypothetical protein
VNNKQEQPIDKSEPIAEFKQIMDELKKNLNTTADEQSAQAKQQQEQQQQQGGQLASQPSAQNLAYLASQKADASQKSDQYESEKEKRIDITRMRNRSTSPLTSVFLNTMSRSVTAPSRPCIKVSTYKAEYQSHENFM